MSTDKQSFHELLRQAREAASQTPEVMGVLLGIDPEDYEAIEQGLKYPDDETLRRLCMMLQWNYYETQRLLINEMVAPGPRPQQAGRSAGGAAPATGAGQTGGERDGNRPDTLGNRLKEVRLVTGQSVEIIAMLLGIDPETYQGIEAGDSPSDAVLRRISMVYNWNYNELLSILRAEQARAFQPRRVGSAYPAASQRTEQLHTLFQEMERLFPGLPQSEQDTVLAQARLIRDTMRQHQTSPAGGAAAGNGVPPSGTLS